MSDVEKKKAKDGEETMANTLGEAISKLRALLASISYSNERSLYILVEASFASVNQKKLAPATGYLSPFT